MEIAYRVRQFWRALHAAQDEAGAHEAASWLSPALLDLFLQQPAFEQAHSLKVLRRLGEHGEHPDLMVAALLHDLGKARFPLRLWERIYIVLVSALAPGWMQSLAIVSPEQLPRQPFWMRPLVIARSHPTWGAQLAEEAGVSEIAVWLIRNHQNRQAPKLVTLNDRLLAKLIQADGNS